MVGGGLVVFIGAGLIWGSDERGQRCSKSRWRRWLGVGVTSCGLGGRVGFCGVSGGFHKLGGGVRWRFGGVGGAVVVFSVPPGRRMRRGGGSSAGP